VETVTSLEAHRRRRWPALLAAAAAVLAIGAGGVVWQQVNDDGPTSRQEQLLTASDAQSFSVDLGNGGTATVIRSVQRNEALLVTEDMPAPPSGHEYVLWLQHGDTMTNAGVMPPGADNEVPFDGDAASAVGAAVSVEEAGTDPTVPSDDVVAVFSFDT
jgi:hypothetical protein